MNINISNSPIEKKIFHQHEIYIKRDDLLHPNFSGNKARKFHYFLDNEFPHIQKIVSYGSSQSNAMYSLSVLAKMRGWRYDYYVEHLSSYLKENPHGNFKYSLKNGMKIHVGRSIPTPTIDDNVLFIEEGGRDYFSEYGIKKLANEILKWKEENSIEEMNIFLPSGTGTTALFLQKNIDDIVYTVPCVGDSSYLKKQFFMLEKDEKYHPTILEPSRKRHFGKLYRDSYNIWLKLRKEIDVEFDLLYDPMGWLTLLENPKIFKKPLLYIHQGGLIGNESMLPRYQRKYNNEDN
ncbi:MAG TPA: 1-aminocyclopropane-1-carboxylate deaminase/D-cysteine desulfhydrase [Campylobacterales bacterium]|nr:1-aminocyclopropane-1-carboxylate deaminase/D-cysteine desulfhydrase [Campylobacterales bacterium]